MVNDINEVIANLTKIDNASAMIMESTKKEKLKYAEIIKQKTKEFDNALQQDIDKKVEQLKTELIAENALLIETFKKESEETLKQLDSTFKENKERWVDSILSNVIKG